jgi:hypothetical protein
MRYLTTYLAGLVAQPQFIADNTGGFISRNEWADQRGGGAVAIRGVEPELYRNEVEPQHEQLARQLGKHTDLLRNHVPELVQAYPIPYAEDWVNSNPVQQLHYLNKKFLLETGRSIVQNPEILVAGFEDINTETGEDESNIEYAYSARSYADGVWRPEHLFVNSQRNRENPEWALLRQEFSNNPNARGPGNRYKVVADGKDVRGIYDHRMHDEPGHPNPTYQPAFHNLPDYENEEDQAAYDRRFENMSTREMMNYDVMAEHGLGLKPEALHLAFEDDVEDIESIMRERVRDAESGRTPADRPRARRKDKFSRGGQIPFWQTTVHTRHYERDNDEGLKEGGISDRRTQRTRGYDMSTLTNRSSTQKRDVPLNKSYF